MIIDKKFRQLRIQMRQFAKRIINFAIKESLNIEIEDKKVKIEYCIFCSSTYGLTKEHVLTKWVYENCEKKDFITSVNGSTQTYNKTVVPTCAICNNDLLANIEKYIITLFNSTDLNDSFFEINERENIIRWLETIDYKFQILETRKKFLKHKSSQYVPYLRDVPIALFWQQIDFSPSKILTQIRIAQKRITQKSKYNSLNSLVIFKSKNNNFHFLHNQNEFIFLELPKFRLAIFYFFSKNFTTEESAYKEAMKIIKLHY